MTAIPGATSSTYVPVTADIGQNITVTVTATNAAGNATASSAAVGPVTSGGGGGANAQALNINIANEGNHYLNIAKQFVWNVDPTIINADGYPTQVPTTSWGCGMGLTPGYYGSWTWSWSGTASMQCSGPPLIVVSGGTYFGLAGSTGDIQGNALMASQTNPTVVFYFGWNIQSITSGGPGGTAIKIVAKTGWVGQFAVGNTIQMQIAGANVNTGANGNWTAVVIDSSSFYLQGSTFTNAQGSAGGTAVYAGSASLNILNSGTLAGFANLVFCRTVDYTAVQAGSYWDGMGGISDLTTLVGQLKDLKPGWLRFMDLSTVQGNFEKDWAQRTPVTAISWPTSDGRWVHGSWIGTFSQTGDAYSCSDPTISVWSGSDYLDGAIVQGHIATPNTGGTPTLAVGGHPALPIIGNPPVPLFITCNSGVGIATIAATGSSYSGTTVTLNLVAGLSGAHAVAVGDRIVLSGITGTGTDIATLNNGGAVPFWTTITGSTGTTIKFTVASGLNITSITGGSVADLTAAAGQTMSFTFSASGAAWLNGGSNYTMSFLTRSSCTDGPTLGFHLEQCVMASNDNNARVAGILLGSTLTVCALASVNGGSYVTSTGATTLTFIGPMDGGQYPSVGDAIVTLSLAGTGAVNSLNGPTYTLTSVSYGNSGGQTLVTVGFTAATGLGSITITSGQLFDSTAAQPCPFISVGRGLHQNVVGAPVISSGGPLVWNLSVGGQTTGANSYQVDPEPVLGFSGTSQSLGAQVINQSWFYTPSAQAGRFTATSLPSSFSSSTIAVGQVSAPSADPNRNNHVTFVYNYLMKAWMVLNGPMGVALPVEAAVQLCNTVGASYWNNILQPSSAYMTSYANYVAANLNSGLKLGIEYGNENWNFTNPRTYILSWGAALGWSVTDSAKANLSFTGLRTKQYSDIIRSAWVSAGRAPHDFYMLSMVQCGSGGIGSVPYLYQNTGQLLNATNFPLFGSYGGLGGGAPSANYDTFPNRPIDACDGYGCAAYWGTAWWAGAYFYVNGPVGANAPALQASLDYANGSTATAFSECVNMFNGTTVPSGLTNYSNTLGAGSFSTIFTSMEAEATQYDGTRQSGYNKLAIMHYEGGPQWATGINLPNGVNSVNQTDIGALAGQIIALQWDVSSYTRTGKPTVASGTYNNSTGVVALTLNNQVRDSNAARFTASCYFQNGFFVLDVSAFATGAISPGMTLYAPSGVATCTIVSFIDFMGAGAGRWEMSVNQTVASQTMFAGDTVTVTGLTGTGAIASLNGTFATAPTTSGTTLSYQAPAGLTLTINNSAGNVYDATAAATEIATNVQTLGQAWKNDVSYKNMIKTSYFQQLANISGINREIHPGQYGYAVDGWGMFPTDYALNTPYQNYYAIKEWDA